MNQIFARLRKHNRKNYMLYLFCNFISLLLITAYSLMMFSDTVLKVLPEGGDSRKQVMMIFVLTCVGCVVFTVYGARLFFKMKAREIGVMLALGAAKKPLKKILMKEVMLLCLLSSLAGMVCGIPFAVGIWGIFRLVVVNTSEMVLHFNGEAFGISFLFLVVVFLAALFSGLPVVNRTNIMDVINEEHKNEMVHEVKGWCGIVGILLLVTGAAVGFLAPNWYKDLLQAYPPFWLSILYVPAFIGVYMIILHTVVNGWHKSQKNRYKELVSRGMMKFQGRQTVNSMLVITMLLAGASFALFYVPLMLVSGGDSLKGREYEYSYHYPGNQKVFGEEEIKQLAGKYGVELFGYKETELANLVMDGNRQIEEEGGKFHYEYVQQLFEGNFLSESAYHYMTGSDVTVNPGECYAVADKEENGTYYLNPEVTIVTNHATGVACPVKFQGYLHYNQLFVNEGYYVISDEDYAKLVKDNPSDWMEHLVFFHVNNDSYEFAKEFYKQYVAGMGEEAAVVGGYDRVIREIYLAEAGEYWGDKEYGEISLKDYESPNFKRNWLYMPHITIMDQSEMVIQYAVFFMMFIFIVIVCMIAAMVIAYIRCITISINNRYVFEDLKRLGGFQRLSDGRNPASVLQGIYHSQSHRNECHVPAFYSDSVYE